MRDVITPELLEHHLGLGYLHEKVAREMNPQLVQSLGIQSLSPQHLLEVGRALVTSLKNYTVEGTAAMDAVFYNLLFL